MSEEKQQQATKNTTKEENVLVPKQVFDDLLSKVNVLEDFIAEQDNRNKPYSREAQKKKPIQVKVHFIKDKVVVDYGKTFDKGGKLFIDLIDENKTPHTVLWEEYFTTEDNHVLCEVSSIDTNVAVDNQGEVYATVVEYDSFRSYQADKSVALEVVKKESVFTVKLPDGREMKLSQKVIN